MLTMAMTSGQCGLGPKELDLGTSMTSGQCGLGPERLDHGTASRSSQLDSDQHVEAADGHHRQHEQQERRRL